MLLIQTLASLFHRGGPPCPSLLPPCPFFWFPFPAHTFFNQSFKFCFERFCTQPITAEIKDCMLHTNSSIVAWIVYCANIPISEHFSCTDDVYPKALCLAFSYGILRVAWQKPDLLRRLNQWPFHKNSPHIQCEKLSDYERIFLRAVWWVGVCNVCNFKVLNCTCANPCTLYTKLRFYLRRTQSVSWICTAVFSCHLEKNKGCKKFCEVCAYSHACGIQPTSATS